MKQSFDAVVLLRGINPYVVVSAEQAGRLRPDWRKPMPVRAWLDGRPDEGWLINLMPVGDGSFYLYLRGDARKAANVKLGDSVHVDLEFAGEDYAANGVPAMPASLREVIEADAAARLGWAALPPSRQKEIVRYYAGLKSDEARSRNLSRALYVLAGGEGRFMARDWNTAEPKPGRALKPTS